MLRRRAVRLTLLGVSALVVTLLVLTVVATLVVVRRPFPEHGGTLAVSGLDGPVEVLRDAQGVPSIVAGSAEDLFRAQGFVHAQDRFFAMDVLRHVTSGRLAELVGADPAALRSDAVVRTLGWRAVAAAEVAQADPATRAYLTAYAAGVNEYLAGRPRSGLALEYTLLGRDLPAVEPWTPEDSVAWFTATSWDLDGRDDELARAVAAHAVGDLPRVDRLFADPARPAAAGDPLPRGRGAAARELLGLLRDGAVGAALAAAQGAAAAVPALAGPADGTDALAVPGRRTASGRPLLAVDVRLGTGTAGAAGGRYEMGLRCRTVTARCPFDVAGVTVPGVPGVVAGRTRTTAWGTGAFGADTTDVYLEKVSGDTVERDGRTEPMTVRTERIAVAGGSPVELVVRATGHGPVLSGVLEQLDGRPAPAGYAVSVASTALQPGHAADVLFALNAAADAAGLQAAARRPGGPGWTVVLADDRDAAGHVGYQATGRIPVRRNGSASTAGQVPTDGRWPLPGWDSRFDWRGTADPADLPGALDPASGPVVAVGGTPDGAATGGPWTRAARVGALLAERSADDRLLTTADLLAVQRDTRTPAADVLVPFLEAVDVDAFTREGRALLRGWDGGQPADSGAAAYANAVWARLLHLTFADDLPGGVRPDGGPRWVGVVGALLQQPRDPWWDDRDTPDVVETRDEVLRRSLTDARLLLTQRMGKDPAHWRWGLAHRLDPVPAVGGAEPVGPVAGVLARFTRSATGVDPVQAGGGPASVDATAWDAATDGFAVTAATAVRFVVDLGDPDGTRAVARTGQSGHPGHPDRTDQLDAWRAGQTFRRPFTVAAVRAAAERTQTLRPPG